MLVINAFIFNYPRVATQRSGITVLVLNYTNILITISLSLIMVILLGLLLRFFCNMYIGVKKHPRVVNVLSSTIIRLLLILISWTITMWLVLYYETPGIFTLTLLIYFTIIPRGYCLLLVLIIPVALAEMAYVIRNILRPWRILYILVLGALLVYFCLVRVGLSYHVFMFRWEYTSVTPAPGHIIKNLPIIGPIGDFN